MVSKKILISGLTIASLGLTGCSGLQDMINNKIASTAKEVSDGINSEVGKATDALKAQGEIMQKDAAIAAAQLKKDLGVMTTYTNTEFGFSLQFPESWGKTTAKVVDKKFTMNLKAFDISSENKAKSYRVMINKKGTTFEGDFGGLLGSTSKYDIYAAQEPEQTDEFKAIDKSFKTL